uniref:Uncharacterized protein n=1 Tax=Trypanosoma rangeli TaxID=5698 RepID=R9TN57_TRYRA|nr:hypothetical protein [Trypanosoma rangeli]
MIALHPFALRRASFVVVAVLVSLLFPGVASSKEVVVGVLDGTHKLTAEDIMTGFRASEKNFITRCGEFDAHGDKFVVVLEMGKFSDYLVPRAGVTLCGLLTSSTTAQKYLYAPQDPREAAWDGHTFSIAPSLYTTALGGSAEGYVSGGRSTLSFWGDNGSDTNHTGGCCAKLPNRGVAWYQPYRLLLVPKEPALYLAWGAKPTIAVTNAPVEFEINVWNMRSEPVGENVVFDITTNGKKVTVTSPVGRYTHFADAPEKGSTKYAITVDLVSGPDTANKRQLKIEVDVVGKLPWDVKPSAGEKIPAFVRFGKEGAAIGPVDGVEALDEDWFASTIVGGESRIRPVAGHFSTARPHSLPPVRGRWENVTQTDGVFRALVPCKSVQYYAVAVYSAVDQRIVVQYEYDTAAVVYFAGMRRLSHVLGIAQKGLFALDVTEGYHQVLVKLFSDSSTAVKDSENCTVVSSFSMRVIGTAVGYTHAVMPDIPEGAYEMWNNEYMFYLLHLGENQGEYLYGGLDEDFINVSTASPRPGNYMSGKIWKSLVFYGGRIPVSAEGLPDDKEAAVSYVAIALYSGYEEKLPLSWTFITGGKADLFIDGERVYGRPSGTGPLTENVTTPISRGWHQLIVRIAATKGQSWGLTFYIRFDNYRIGGSHSPGTNLPFGVAFVRPNMPLLSLMALVDMELQDGAIPFDPSNATAVSDEFTDLPIDASYMPGLLSLQSIWALGQERRYQWVGKVSDDGNWGSHSFGGNFNQYWSFVLYATEQMQVTVRVMFHGGYTMWLGGAVVGSAPLSWEKEVEHTLSLEKGWNQPIIKLRANNSFHFVDTKDGTMTWTKANAVCTGTMYMELCPQSAVCPLGVGRPGVLPVAGGSAFVPVNTAENEWVQVSAEGGSGTSMCETWRKAHGGQSPEWGEASDDIPERHLVPCCGGNPPPSMWLSITPSPDAKGELGYAYDVPIVVEAPVVTVDDPAALTQTVRMVSATPDATIKYAVNNASEMVVYTGPLTITASSTIVAQAFAQNRESQMTHFLVEIDSEPSVDRIACVENARCSLFVSGVDPNWRIAVVSTKIPGKLMKNYLYLDYALQQKPSLNFSGVLDMENHRVVVPPFHSGTYNVIPYHGAAKARMMLNVLAYRETKLIPSEVLGAQETMFRIEGGVGEGDAALLPFSSRGSPTTCDVAACTAALNSERDRVAVLLSSDHVYFTQDLYGYAGELSCLCLCLSCSKGVPRRESLRIEPSNVVSQTVNVSVLSPGPSSGESVGAVRPHSVQNGDILELFGVFVASSRYSVRFVPAASAGGSHVAPLCTIDGVRTGSLMCKMQVRAGAIGMWNVSLMNGATQVPFAKGTRNEIQVIPRVPLVESARGVCAATSAKCVTGAQMTFYGANFNPVQPSYNDVIVGEAVAANPILCRVTIATEAELTCVLSIPRDKEHGTYPIRVRVRASETEWAAEQGAGFLVLGEGAHAPGWKANDAPRPAPANDDKRSNTAFIVWLVFGSLVLVLLVVVIVIYFPPIHMRRINDAIEAGSNPRELQLRKA